MRRKGKRDYLYISRREIEPGGSFANQRGCLKSHSSEGEEGGVHSSLGREKSKTKKYERRKGEHLRQYGREERPLGRLLWEKQERKSN